MDTEITQITRPNISEIGAKLLIEKVYGINVVVIKTLSSFSDKNYFVQANGDTWTNRNINEICSFGYVFKMLNAEDSKLNHVGEHTNKLSKFIIHYLRKLIRASQKKYFALLEKKEFAFFEKIILFASLKKKSFALLEKKNLRR